VTLSGHCDPRGTDEYNLALSERRAQTVRDYLQRMGIPAERMRTLPRGALDATGTDETGWSRDRRVDSEWQ
jgi:peptidoglycan-associated lipoprotein